MRKNAKDSGQALLITVFIGLLLLAAIPIVVLINMTGMLHHVAAAKRDKGTAVAEAGIQYAAQMFTTAPNAGAAWGALLTSAAIFPSDCNSNSDILGADGSHFRLVCQSLNSHTNPCPAAANCQPYQVRVVSTAYMPETGQPGKLVPTRSLQAFFSKKTLAVSMPTGYTAAAAMATMKSPFSKYGHQLVVYYGPIVNYDMALWTFDPSCDYNRIPRKFSPGPVTHWPGTPMSLRAPDPTYPSTDQKEYWAYTSVGFPPVIDSDSYKTSAINTPVVIQKPICFLPDRVTAGPALPATCIGNPSGNTNCGYFDVSQCPSGYTLAVFDGGGNAMNSPASLVPGYALNGPNDPNAVIYVKGNAEFRRITINVRPLGAVIVDGNLTLGYTRDVFPAAYPGQPFPCAPTRALDDPYHLWGAPPPPCPATSQYVDLQGFVYVTGNLTVDFETGPDDSAKPEWNAFFLMAGAIRIDGLLTLQVGHMGLIYDDVVNHNIRTTNFELMSDLQNDVPAQ